jgi:hypothetical protein
MQKDGQMSFTDAELLLQKKQTRRERFLAQLDELVPWTDLLAVIEPHYPRSGHRGRQPIGLEVMLRIHLVQLAYNSRIRRWKMPWLKSRCYGSSAGWAWVESQMKPRS